MEGLHQRLIHLRSQWNQTEASRLRAALRQRRRRNPYERDTLSGWMEEIKKLEASRRLCARRDERLEHWQNELVNLRYRLENGENVLSDARRLRNSLNTYIRVCRRQHTSYRAELDGCFAELGDIVNRSSNQHPWIEVASAFEGRIITGVISNFGIVDPRKFLEHAGVVFQREVTRFMQNQSSAVKLVLTLHADFVKDDVHRTIPLITPTLALFPADDISAVWRRFADMLWEKLSNFEIGESGLQLDSIRYLKVNVNTYNPIRSGAQLSDSVRNSKAVINVKNNNDGKCFLWSVLAKLYPACQHVDRLTNYEKYSHKLKWEEKDFPMTLKGVHKFEKENNLSIWVFGLDNDDKLYPLYKSKQKDVEIVDLLMLEGNPTFHTVLIKDIDKLLHSQGHRTKARQKLCRRCLHYRSERDFDIHKLDCDLLNTQGAIKMGKEPIIQFTNYRYREPVPITCFADFESKLVPLEDGRVRHDPIAAGLFVNPQDSVPFEGYYEKCISSECHLWLLHQLDEVVKHLFNIYKDSMITKVPTLTATQEEDFRKVRKCHICRKYFKHGERRVKDHCHWSGEYRGAAHNDCNQNYKLSRIVPVYFHNLSHYDAHFIVKALIRLKDSNNIKMVASNEETLIYCTLYYPEYKITLQFVDSYRFMPDSLDRLGKNLDPSMKVILRSFFPRDEDFQLVCQKGIYPYDYVKDSECLDTTITIPEKNAFYNKFNSSHISDEEYEHAKRVWDHFKIKSLRQYTLLYLKTDVLLLADVFENFRRECLLTYQLDPAHYVTAPSLTYDAALKITGVKLERIMDLDMYMFIEKAIRGGMVQACCRYAQATPGETCITYLDVTNLYGWAMSQPLPYSNFSWMDENEWRNVGSEDPDIGYYLEVDLEYPRELHDHHSDFPLAPEHRKVTKSGEKLMLTLYNKERYVIYHRNLALYQSLGLKCVKVHRILRFHERPWLKEYVELNANKRKMAKNEFEKNFYKLMVNSLFGKTIENVRKRQDVHLVTRWEGRGGGADLIARPNFSHSTPVDDGAVIKMMKKDIILDKPIYIGATILEVSKTLMYDFHYNFTKKEFPSAQLLYTDTDSLLYLLPIPHVDNFIERNPARFDTSSYPKDHPLYSSQNAKRVGSMKDEVDGKVITEFVALRPKLYAYEVDGKTFTRAKGVRRPALAKITLQDYKDCLFNDNIKKVNQPIFQSKAHVIYTVMQEKLGLSANDDKRYCEGEYKIRTLPWGHYSINDEELLKAEQDG
ncbi:MAG TPA: DNA polymerase [Methylomirabilota bacterium]|nr:DNA polymerase [Methylomirabilota bacterium]